jgi:hypothetical protein
MALGVFGWDGANSNLKEWNGTEEINHRFYDYD